jgi:hypothetical protein
MTSFVDVEPEEYLPQCSVFIGNKTEQPINDIPDF